MAKRPPSYRAGASGDKPRRWAATTRRSRQQRGYGAEWEKLRRQVLDDEPLCRLCTKAGRAVIATTVDHIKPKHQGGTDERRNLQPLCDDCHKAKTAREGRSARD